MDFTLLNDLLYSNFSWWPWTTFWNDVWFLQFFIIYLLYLIFLSTNLYYTLLYLFFEIIYIGLYISLIQSELFTGFLWVLEGTIVFIALLLLFHLNTDGYELKNNLKLNKYLYLISNLFFVAFLSRWYFFEELEYKEIQILNNFSIWDDYYSMLFNINLNDFKLLFLSYYTINSFEFISIGVLLLVGSLSCVNLNRYQKFFKISEYSLFLNKFHFYKDFVDYLFLRKQNLNLQTFKKPGIKVFKKK
jgi:hypothetical protein